jgi:HKD family nuclease
VFVPAHQWAFSKLDKKYGHYRRYNHKTMIRALSKVTNYTNVSYQYFNIIGLLGWIIKYKILKNEYISKNDIRIFERLIPAIKNIDDFLHHKLKIRIGQSMIFVVTL